VDGFSVAAAAVFGDADAVAVVVPAAAAVESAALPLVVLVVVDQAYACVCANDTTENAPTEPAVERDAAVGEWIDVAVALSTPL